MLRNPVGQVAGANQTTARDPFGLIGAEERSALARTAISMVPPGGTVGVGGGGAMAEFAGLLSRRGPLTVVTTALDVAVLLARAPGIALTVTAGETVPGTPNLAGPAAIRSLRDVYLDLAVVQADGLTEDGITSWDEPVAAMIGALMRRAAVVFVLAEARAIGHRAPAPVPGVPRRFSVITHASADGRILDELAGAGVAVVRAR